MILASSVMEDIAKGVGVLVVFAVLGFITAAVAVLWQIRSYVLPHFQPPKPGETDTSIPARQERMEHDIVEMRTETAGVRQDLVEHMREEELRGAQAREKLDRSLSRLHSRIDETLPRRRRRWFG